MKLNWFDTPYYKLLYKNRNEKEARLFIDNILKKINIRPNSKILDLACGTGRHSIYLSKRGFNVVGIDQSKKNIISAKENENEKLIFFQQEMTKDINMQFNAIFNFFTSFGYVDHKYNYNTIENISKNLKKGGLFIIDFLNQKIVRKNLVEYEEKNIEPYDVYSADEAFISATPFCMLPVVSLNNIKIGNGKVGKIYNKFLETWSRNVGVNIKSQIKNWDRKKKLKVTPYRFKK